MVNTKIGSKVWVLETSKTPYRIMHGEITSIDDNTYIYVRFEEGSRGCYEADGDVFETEDDAWEHVEWCVERRREMLWPYEDLLKKRPNHG